MAETICAVIFFTLSAVALIICIFAYMEKGFLFHNAYIYASKQERSTMNKKPYYHQSAVAFLLAGISLFLLGIGILGNIWAIMLAIAVAVSAGIYAITMDKANHAK